MSKYYDFRKIDANKSYQFKIVKRSKQMTLEDLNRYMASMLIMANDDFIECVKIHKINRNRMKHYKEYLDHFIITECVRRGIDYDNI